MTTDIFTSWRRKWGIVTLVLALVMMVVWIRSFTVREEVVVIRAGRLHAFMSASGSFSWVAWSDESVPESLEWEINVYFPETRQTFCSRSPGMLGKITNFQWSDTIWESSADKSRFWIVRYQTVTLGLTLLAGYLLLVKSRSSSRIQAR